MSLARVRLLPSREVAAWTMIKTAGQAAGGAEVLAFCTAAAAIDNLHWRVHRRPAKIPAMLPGFERLAIDLERICFPARSPRKS